MIRTRPSPTLHTLAARGDAVLTRTRDACIGAHIPVREGGTMRRLPALLLVLLAASACEKHGAQPRPAAVSNPAPADIPPDAGPHQTIRLGQNAIVPDATTIAPSTTIDFQNMTWESLTIRFIAPP